MKECSKKWYKCKTPGDGIYDKYTFFQGWRAALEWVLEQGDKSCWINDLALPDIIQKELNNEPK